MTLHETHGFTRCAVGVARRDVTPPVGIYARSWGAARHDVAEGVHRPLTATAAALRPLAGDGPDLVLVALDIGWFPYRPDERRIRGAILAATGLGENTLLINMSHTHAGASVNTQLADRPGGELVGPYLERMVGEVAAAIGEARERAAPGWITYGYGRCALAANRDFWAPELGRYICGYNPGGPADDTVLVARVTADDGTTLATLVNYACHPTTLAWENRLLSPDYIGATREVLEGIHGAPCLFLYGAAGELGPREGFVGDPAVADRNGRQLGYAAAAAIEALPPPGQRLTYTGVVASGANLATWAYRPLDPAAQGRCARLANAVATVPLARKASLTPVDPPSADGGDPAAEAEKARRRGFIQAALGDDPVHQMPIWAWRLGDALLAACPNEAYSQMQTELRARFPGSPVLVLGCTNGTVGYLPPRATYGSGRYQEQQSPFLPGCLEQATDAAAEALGRLRAEG
ncbi:MAG TPA: hypothetical protein PKD53_12100 [Chloroflexaceae bacterium]|nr:hypothetical protein [Chloroflexaceae bacterium]